MTKTDEFYVVDNVYIKLFIMIILINS